MRKLILLFLVVVIMAVFSFPLALHADYTYPSTNELNRDKEVPGREGQDAPHVNLKNYGVGYVELEFVNNTNSLTFFEYRIDGKVLDSGTEHPVVTGDYIYPGVSNEGREIDEPVIVNKTFYAGQKVEIRLALGGERDWDFGWTTFEVAPSDISAIFECWKDNGDGTYTLVFGYENNSTLDGETVEVEIPLGYRNKLTGGNAEWNDLLPTKFIYPQIVDGRPGRTAFGAEEPNAFIISDYTPDMGNIVWTLNGRTATGNTSHSDQECKIEEPELEPAPPPAPPVVEVEALATYTITATTGNGGSIDPIGEVDVAEGDSQTFTITPAADPAPGEYYSISDVLVDGVSVGAVSSYTFENVQANHTIHVDFGRNVPSDATVDAAAITEEEPVVEVLAIEELPYTGFDYIYCFLGIGVLIAAVGLLLVWKKLGKANS